MKQITSNMIVVLTLLNLCLLIDAVPSLENVKIVSDDNRSMRDESDNSSEKSEINVKHDAPSKCGYEVEQLIYQFNRETLT